MVGGRICGSPVPKGLSQLPRPAIIRLSGSTISVNVPDSELRSPSKANLLEVSARREYTTNTVTVDAVATAKYCPLHYDSRTKCVFRYSSFDPALSRLPAHVCAAIFKQYRVLPSVQPDAVRCVEIRRRRTRHILTLSQAEKLPFAVNILRRRDSQI